LWLSIQQRESFVTDLLLEKTSNTSNKKAVAEAALTIKKSSDLRDKAAPPGLDKPRKKDTNTDDSSNDDLNDAINSDNTQECSDVIETRTKKSATAARKEGTSYSDDVDCNDSDEDDKPTKKCNKKGATKGPYHLRR
jgi:hypothetical protein